MSSFLKSTTRHPHKIHCPYCNYASDQATAFGNDSTPGPGSISVCFHCGELSLFTDEMLLRKLTPRELLDLQLSPDWPLVERMQMATRAMHERRKA